MDDKKYLLLTYWNLGITCIKDSHQIIILKEIWLNKEAVTPIMVKYDAHCHKK